MPWDITDVNLGYIIYGNNVTAIIITIIILLAFFGPVNCSSIIQNTFSFEKGHPSRIWARKKIIFRSTP